MSDIIAEQVSEMNADSNTNTNASLTFMTDALVSDLSVDNTPFMNIEANELRANENLNSYKRAFSVIFELSDDELGKIEDHIRSKIVNNGENFLQQHETLKANYEKFKIEYEQRFIELEADFNESQTKLGLELKSSHTYKLKASENDEALSRFTKQNRILEDEKETLASHNQRLISINQNIEAEKRDLHVLLDKRIKENDRLTEEWKLINTKYTESESKLIELTVKLEEYASKEATIEFREKQFQSDKQRLLNEIDWLNKQLTTKSSQILEIKGSFNQKVYDLDTRLEDCLAENKRMKSSIETFQTANASMEGQIEDLTKKLQEVREKEVQTRLDFSEEAQLREKLIYTYKEELNETKDKLQMASQTIEEMKQMVLEINQEYKSVSDEKDQESKAFEAKLKEKEMIVSKLEQELKNANELLSIAKRKGATVLSESDIEQLSPAAAVASRLLKSGMSLTQIYSEHVNLSETLQQEKKENERLKSYIEELVRDIEEKAPTMIRQKHEYEESVKTINNLTEQLEKSMMDFEVLKSKSEDSIKKYNLVTSENMRLKQDIQDFSRQITVLLHEIETMRRCAAKSGSLTTPIVAKIDLEASHMNTSIANLFASNEEIDLSVSEVTSSSEVQNKNLFLFRNIEELQKQNQKLVQLVHEITYKKQSEEKIEFDSRTKEYNEKLNLAMRELDEFKRQREKQEQVLEEISKQRDTYKHLLNQQQQFQQQAQSDFFASTPSAQKRKTDNFGDLDEKLLQQQLNETMGHLELVRKNFEKYKEEMGKTNKILNEDIDSYRTKNSDLSLRLALAESKLESSLERCKTLNTNAEKSRKELETAKERMSKLNEIIIKHEQSINLTTQELNRMKEKSCEIETRLHSITLERDMYKSNQDRLSKENVLLLTEKNSRNTIHSDLQLIRNSCERSERETKLIYSQKVEQLEKEILIKSKQIEHDKEQNMAIIKSWTSQYEQLDSQHKKANEEHEKTRSILNQTQKKFEELQQKYNEIEAKLHSNEMLVQMTRNTKSSSAISRLTHLEEETKDLNMKLSLAEKEIVSLKMQLEETKAHAKQYKIMSETMEHTVKESSEINEKTKQILETKINDMEVSFRNLQNEYENLLNVRNELESRLNSEKQALDARIEQLEREKLEFINNLDTLQKRFDNVEKILEERTRNRDEYAAKIAVLEEQLKQSSNNLFELETRLNEKLNELNETKQNLDVKNSQLEQSERTLIEMKQNAEQMGHLEKENMDNLRAENNSLMEQINILQQELTKVGQDICVLKTQDSYRNSPKRDSSLFGAVSGISDSATMDTSSNMLEINRFLRTQKEELEKKYEELNLNYQISEQRMKTIENELEFTRKQSQMYESEISQLKNSLSNSKSQGSLSLSDENNTDLLNLTMDTNKRMKDDYDQLVQENTKLTNDLRQIEEEVLNVKASLSQSELRNESLMGTNVGLTSEVKRWKDRSDAFLRASDNGQEWIKIQEELKESQEKTKDELKEAQGKNQELTDIINQLRNDFTDLKAKSEQVERDLEAVKNQNINDKAKHQQREEMFKTVVNELKEIVTTCQKELQLTQIDWGNRSGQDRIKNMKEDFERIKNSIIDKIRIDRDDLKTKIKLVEDAQGQVLVMQKKLEESENKIKEKETRIGQLNNVFNSNKTKISALQQEITNLKTQQTNVATATTAATAATIDSSHVQKSDFEAIKSKLLQTHIDNEKLKKELFEANCKLTSNQLVVTAAAQPTPSSSGSTSPKQQNSIPTTSSTTNTTSMAASINPGQETQQTPTAYIAPSRINKIQPTQQQTQQQTSANVSSGSSSSLMIRRTAAVQPQPHDSGTNNQRQQYVPPMSVSNPNESSQAQAQTQSFNMTENVLDDAYRNQQQQQEAPSIISMSSNQSTTSFAPKRNREEDPLDDLETNNPTTSGGNNSNNSSTQYVNKKKRSLLSYEASENQNTVFQTNFQTFNRTSESQDMLDQDLQIAAVEPFSSLNPTPVADEYLIVGDEMASSGNSIIGLTNTQVVQEEQQQQQNQEEVEIVLEDNGDSQGSGFEEIPQRTQQQNLLSSTSSDNQNQNSSELPNYQDDQDVIVEDNEEQDEDDSSVQNLEGNNDEEDQNQEEANDDGSGDNEIEENSESNQDDMHLVIQGDDEGGEQDNVEGEEENDSPTNEESESNTNYGEGNTNPDSEQNEEESQTQQNQNLVSPNNLISQPNQDNPQNVNASGLTTESSMSATQQQTQQKSNLFSNLNPLNARPVFGASASNTMEQRKEAPKPIVWDGTTTSTLFQPTSGAAGSGGGRYSLKRPPLSQNPTGFMSTQQATSAGSQLIQSATTTQNYFQQELQLQNPSQQQHQQQQNTGFQSSQFRLQNNRFQFQASSLGSGVGLDNQASSNQLTSLMGQQQQQLQNQPQLTNQPRLMHRGAPRAQLNQQQQQQSQQQQQTGRIIQTSGLGRGGMSRGGGNAGGPTGGTRGARNNF